VVVYIYKNFILKRKTFTFHDIKFSEMKMNYLEECVKIIINKNPFINIQRLGVDTNGRLAKIPIKNNKNETN